MYYESTRFWPCLISMTWSCDIWLTLNLSSLLQSAPFHWYSFRPRSRMNTSLEVTRERHRGTWWATYAPTHQKLIASCKRDIIKLIYTLVLADFNVMTVSKPLLDRKWMYYICFHWAISQYMLIHPHRFS